MRDKSELNICIVDYGMGNLRSVYKQVAKYSTCPLLTANPDDILKADKLILPGVGHFAQGMLNLEKSGLKAVLGEKVMVQGTPILGICLGMQLFTQYSEEGDVPGLGWLDAKTKKFNAQQVANPHFKVPHMGWNTLNVQSKNPVYKQLTEEEELYFCHSYYVESQDASIVASTCSYGFEFCASVEQNNIHGMQFHPEKSHAAGAQLIENFIKLGAEVLT